MTNLICLDSFRGGCNGEVALRESLSGTGVPMARCDAHQEERLKEQERIEKTYHVNSDSPPPGFDPADAGEHWDYDY